MVCESSKYLKNTFLVLFNQTHTVEIKLKSYDERKSFPERHFTMEHLNQYMRRPCSFQILIGLLRNGLIVLKLLVSLFKIYTLAVALQC
jgi:hypothetical protein